MQRLEPPGFTIRVADAGAFETMLAVDGARLTRMEILNGGVELGARADEGWREMLSGGGMRAVKVIAEGAYAASPAEVRLRDMALSGESAGFVISLEQDRAMSGPFIVTQFTLEEQGGTEVSFRMELASSGKVKLA